MENEHLNSPHFIILEKLGSIDKNLAVNTTTTANIGSAVSKIELDLKETKNAVQIANGRTGKLEEWSKEARVIIENTSKTTSENAKDNIKFWTAIKLIWAIGTIVMGLVTTILWYKAHEIARKEISSPETRLIIKQAVVEALEERAIVEHE